jgi:two-component system chemotaxis response regulator CheB
VVALVASAGGLAALTRVLAGLPASLPAAVVVALHTDPKGPGALSGLLAVCTRLRVQTAIDGDHLERGTVLVTPPGRHLLVTSSGTVALVEAGAPPPARPSADLLLATLAVSAGARAIAVVLTGHGHDGQVGVRAVHHCGGRVLAQDQATAEHFGMPGAAIATGIVDEVVALDRLPDAIAAQVAALPEPG